LDSAFNEYEFVKRGWWEGQYSEDELISSSEDKSVNQDEIFKSILIKLCLEYNPPKKFISA
jgi:hypothetical protein